MDCVNSMCKIWNCTPFEIQNQNVDHFINAVNYLIMKGEQEELENLAKYGYDVNSKNDPLRMFI